MSILGDSSIWIDYFKSGKNFINSGIYADLATAALLHGASC